MSTASSAHLDEAVVSRLLRELSGDVPAAVRFLMDFVRAWEGRVARLLDAADRDDPEDVTTVLLSVRTASGMLGATALFAAAGELQCRVSDTGRVDGPSVRRLVQVGTASCHELAALAQRLESASS